jgi:hypothetical protein
MARTPLTIGLSSSAWASASSRLSTIGSHAAVTRRRSATCQAVQILGQPLAQIVSVG